MGLLWQAGLSGQYRIGLKQSWSNSHVTLRRTKGSIASTPERTTVWVVILRLLNSIAA